jgi:hypothetical protein
VSGGGKNQIQETPQQRAAVDHAVNLMKDYTARWLPVQENLAKHIVESGQAGSRERTAATGRASTDNAIQFSRAGGAVEKSLANSGAAPGSAKFNLGVTGLGEDQAKSRGMGAVMSDQMVDDAYTKGLTALMATGRGERQEVGNALGDQATMSGRQAAMDAEAAMQQRAGQAQIGAQFAGLGLQQALKPSTGPNLTVDYNGYGINNPYGAGAR